MDFVKSNYIGIMIVVVGIIGGIVVMHIFNISFNTYPGPTELVPIATIETMTSLNSTGIDTVIGHVPGESETDVMMSPDKSFCKLYEGQSHNLEGACENLTRANCKKSSCCGWLNDSKCVAGNSSGPTFDSDSTGKTLPIDTYYYMNKCSGSGCKA